MHFLGFDLKSSITSYDSLNCDTIAISTFSARFLWLFNSFLHFRLLHFQIGFDLYYLLVCFNNKDSPCLRIVCIFWQLITFVSALSFIFDDFLTALFLFIYFSVLLSVVNFGFKFAAVFHALPCLSEIWSFFFVFSFPVLVLLL